MFTLPCICIHCRLEKVGECVYPQDRRLGEISSGQFTIMSSDIPMLDGTHEDPFLVHTA